MKQRAVILVAAFFALACVTGRFLMTPPPVGPVTISFIGYTNEPTGTEAASAVGHEPEATFQLTNHTGSELRCHFYFEAVCTNGLTSGSGGEYYLAAHEARRLLMPAPAGTNGWRFQAVFSASGPRPSWQQRASTLLGRLGLNSVFPAGERKYPQVTNIWANL
jgi:hypothetical protein